MSSNENQRVHFHRAPENNTKIAFADLLLFIVSFLFAAVIVKGTWQLAAQSSVAERIAVLLSLHWATC